MTTDLGDEAKTFATLQAQFAITGHRLHRTNPADGPVSYYATRWGQSRELPTLESARTFLAVIGGAR